MENYDKAKMQAEVRNMLRVAEKLKDDSMSKSMVRHLVTQAAILERKTLEWK